MNISVVGLGKLGAVMAAILAERGHEVVGVDMNPAAVAAVNEGRAPVREPGLEEMIRKSGARLSATTDTETAVSRTELTFVVVPTPSGADGTFSIRYVLAAAESIAEMLRKKSRYHLVIITSTVMPGATGGQVLPLLERVSGRKCGPDFGLCYNPEFIALGSVIRDMSSPDMILIGESDTRAGGMLEELYGGVCLNHPPVARMNFVNAELTKLSVNTFVTTKISYANMLAEVCERVPGADAEVVSAAIGLDTRIGRKYLQGALGYGGPCFPRDNAAFASFASQHQVEATLAQATDRVNRRQVARLGDQILRLLPDGAPAGILGLSYKPDTEVIDESQGVMLAQYLLAAKRRVIVYDPAAMENARGVLTGDSVTFAPSMEACAGEAAVLAVTTPWTQFKSLRQDHLRQSGGRPVIIDCWRILPRAEFEAVAVYIPCGQGPALANEDKLLFTSIGS